MKSPSLNKKVFIGMSGGVDSSVSAALLKRQGYDVTGVFIKVWQPDWVECTWKEDRRDAMRVAADLDIPFLTFDFENEYKREVVDYMIAEYKDGRTPNPDIMCNKYIKFGAFYDKAMSMGADFVATGHYATIKDHGTGQIPRYFLAESADKNKDQSYFLWTLKPEQLAHTIFPIGHMQKDEVRRLAKSFGLYTAEKKDSQGLCFIGKVEMEEFLSHFIEKKPGQVLDKDGQVIGKHNGAIFLTIGQRHGFDIIKKTANDKALYVIDRNIEKNTVTVSDREDNFGNGLRKTMQVKDMVLNLPARLHENSIELDVRIRYRQEKQRAKLELSTGIVIFDKEQIAVTSGQFAVFYMGDICVGGGTIE